MGEPTKARTRESRPPKVCIIDVIEVTFLRGLGVEHDPVREVTAYYFSDGTLLVERDPVPA